MILFNQWETWNNRDVLQQVSSYISKSVKIYNNVEEYKHGSNLNLLHIIADDITATLGIKGQPDIICYCKIV